ncbi:MAG TPA: hypothetical protein VFK87_10585 [Steroidobacteraceae bacterium]|nr:hypothetical protein [Steroidobacteraceae bacterium]
MKIGKIPAVMAAITGSLLNIVALAQAPVVPSAPVRVPSVPVQGIMQAVQPVPLDPLATLKLLAVCTCQEPSAPYQVGSVSATAVTLADGQQWLVDGNTIVRSGMTLLSLANLHQGQWVIMEGTVAIDGRSLYAVVIEAFDYAVTLTGYANPANPLTLSGPSGSVSAYFGPWTTWMDFTGLRLNQASMRGRALPPGSQLLATVRTGSDGKPYVVAMAIK